MSRPAWLLCLLCSCTDGGTPAARIDHGLAARLPAGERDKIAGSTVPVLLPRALDVSRATFVVERTYTALHLPVPGMVVSVHAARIAHHHPGVRPDRGERQLRGGPGRVTVNEGIWHASWVERGVAYALDLECAAAGDPRCADEGTLLALVEELGEVGP